MVPAHVWRSTGHTGPFDGAEPVAERGIIDRTHGEGRAFVRMADGCDIDVALAELTLAEADATPATETPAETPVGAPQTPADPIEAWEQGLADSGAVLDAIWAAADEAANQAGACPEYERTTAWPHGHTGRPHVYRDEDEENMGAGDVTFSRVIERTIRVTQSVTINVEAGDDPYETLDDEYPEWNDEDEELWDESTYNGPDIYADDREALDIPDEDTPRTPPAALVRAALESGTEWRTIRDAILTTARAHGAPLESQARVSLSASVSRYLNGEWQAPTMERVNNVAVSDTRAQSLRDHRTSEAYEVARYVYESESSVGTRIMHPTLSAVVTTDWQVTA